VLRRFWVKLGREEAFEQIFGPVGDWVELLSSSAGYRGSELKLESQTERQYQVRDFWQSHLHFERFRSQAAEELAEFAGRLVRDGIVEKEIVLGSFYEDEPGAGEGDDLVSA
jgi:heme-degrading monooxygenase HmoA